MKVLRLIAIILSLATFIAAGENWPDWRGPTYDGVSTAKGLPVSWSETENVVWKTAIHDIGWSTPVIWDDQIWMTTATEDGKQLFAVCVDFKTGQIVHDIKVFDIAEPQRKHPQNSYATPSPVIEKGRVYVHYGTHGTACIDTKTGVILWRWDAVQCEHVQGPASSPFLFENLLILHIEGNDVQYIIALDKLTAKEIWRAERPQEYYTGNPLYYKAYTTPIIVNVNGKPQLVSNGSKVCLAYDPRTGEEIWRVVYGGDSTISRPIFGDGLVYVNVGWKEQSSELWAVDPTGTGNITDTHVKWKILENIPIESSPVFANHLIFTVDDRGTISCIDPKNGQFLWQQDFKGFFGASPIVADGTIYFSNKKNSTIVLAASADYQLFAENILDEGFMASPAVKDKSLILRTKTHLYRIEE
ncbi:PQQ-binding-like beta-propeller repeat protein [candidate division KSB1 bacterium]|nr:PQQ-binding-like beta-propeller repeat protein [candidate division KSB1 bacterium]